MNRRSALKNLSLVLGTTALPNWAYQWNKQSLPAFQGPNSELLGAIVNAIIPETDSPGAKTIGAHLYIERMVKDCMSQEDQQAFQNGLQKLASWANKNYQKAFPLLSSQEQISLLTSLQNSTQPEENQFFKRLKGLTIASYLSSEYFLTQHRNYTMAPGFYHGCVPVQ
ncbi:gluconate 2-dehydrogenase subunit 3 family protein [Cytophagaceae bacterium 50C-KIRBA]|uniref:Gluconate 2-dehydrogenase subunit 3 family protein n=1 Tax=Aquirufa beregesia TaxID=2516556 RepID=A0ABX0EWW4_9BACT|nr:gluconate 2-dehydrogenase subunit 3 family protein [Aquirufa beregesia]NGZ44618.1 gluconate 2-dehydrogenase subunit 3 family protein [Aquirufa beregesia]